MTNPALFFNRRLDLTEHLNPIISPVIDRVQFNADDWSVHTEYPEALRKDDGLTVQIVFYEHIITVSFLGYFERPT